MAARLTDRQRKMIMADRAGEMSIRQLANKYHVSTTTIQRVLKISDAGLSQIATSFGIIVDKATKNTASGNDSLNKLDGLLKEFQDAVKSEAN